MTREEAKAILEDCLYKAEYKYGAYGVALKMAIKALEQEPCEDWYDVPSNEMTLEQAQQAVKDLRKRFREDLEQEPKTGHCKDCKYFEYDSVAKVDGIPLIVAHEICSRWGDGCKTKEDGYCFLYEPQERSDKE